MRFNLPLSGLGFIVLLASQSCKQPAASQQSQAVLISGTIYQTEAYCGGAAPNPQRLQQMNTPKPLAGKTVYIKPGKVNDPEAGVAVEVTSDERGEFSLTLEPGWYVMVDEKRMDKASYNYMLTNFAEPSESYTAVDKKCLDQWVTEANLVFEVKEGENEPLSVTFHEPCTWNSFPCVNFIGERPR